MCSVRLDHLALFLGAALEFLLELLPQSMTVSEAYPQRATAVASAGRVPAQNDSHRAQDGVLRAIAVRNGYFPLSSRPNLRRPPMFHWIDPGLYAMISHSLQAASNIDGDLPVGRHSC